MNDKLWWIDPILFELQRKYAHQLATIDRSREMLVVRNLNIF